MSKDRSAAEIGDWYAYCCIHDLQQIETAEDLEDAMHGELNYCVWASLGEAVHDLVIREDYEEFEDFVADAAYAKEKYGIDVQLKEKTT